MFYTCSRISSIGGRACNEDSVQLRHIGSLLMAVVADGLGGMGGGDVASSAAVSAVSSFMESSPLCTPDNIGDAIRSANGAVLGAQKQYSSMTTIVLLCLDGQTAICGHMGDSRLYQFRGDKVLFQTKDHSVSQVAVIVGEIAPEEIRRHADRHKLLRALGADENMAADTVELPVRSGDGFLLCTDGFWELIVEEDMEADFQVSQDAEGWLEKMSRRIEARLTDKSDNYSAITVIIK
jgi:serine/threonine protein phosphatase PrpC